MLNKMADDIVRRIPHKRTYLQGSNKFPKFTNKPRFRHSDSCFSPSRKKSNVKPFLESTPQKYVRKSIDNSDCGSYTERDLAEKRQLIDNLTPIRKRKIRIKRSLGGCEESLGRPTDVNKAGGDKSRSSSFFKNDCGDSFDDVLRSPVQAEMLSVDESLLETLDLDSVAKDYWNSQNRSAESVGKKLEREEQSSPDMFERISSDTHEETNKLAESSREVCDFIIVTENDSPQVGLPDGVTDRNSVVNGAHYESECSNLDTRLNDEVGVMNYDWEDDSFLDHDLNKKNMGVAEVKSPVLGNRPLNSKIQKALMSNAQKPVTPKPKTTVEVKIHTEHTSSNTEKDTKFFDIGPFFGLTSKVKSLLQKLKGISKLYPWQEECLNMDELRERRNLVYALPTSGGKTLVAEILILRELLCYKKNAIFILPFVSIVQEKVQSLAPFGLELDFFVEEYAAGKGQYPPRKRRNKQSVFVATIEKALGLINSLIEINRLDEVGLVVVDELHLVGETSGRGATLEGLLTKLLYVKESIQIVGMSATIGNLEEVADFLCAKKYTQDFRPVELKEYVKYEDTLYAVHWSAAEPGGMFTPERTLSSCTGDPDCVGGLVKEVVPDNSCLVFCPTKKNCENVAQLICSMLPQNILFEHKKKEKKALYRALQSEGNGSVCPILKKTLPFGMAYHHSGLTADEKRLLQEAYLDGTLCCICCTSTLAAGVNLPAKRVILRSPYMGRNFINLSPYKQMVGRAGRTGFGEAGESIIICKTNEVQKVKEMFASSMDKVVSSLHLDDYRGMQNLLMSAIVLGIATSRADLQKVSKCTLLSKQASQLDLDVNFVIDQTINHLIKLSALRIEDQQQNSPVLSQILGTPEPCKKQNEYETPPCKSSKRLRLNDETKFKISRLGKAAIKGCVRLSYARTLYKDLTQAQTSLVLSSCLHLLYLVTPYDLVSHVKPNPTTYFSVYNRLGAKELQTTKVLGISEACMMRMVNGQNVKSVQERVLNRFYLTLMLFDLWNQKSVWDVSDEYQVPRGFVQNLMTCAAAFSSSVMRFCEEIQEFWAFKDLLVNFSQQLSHCCTAELIPLMELPAVKRGRAKQLYKAGYKRLQDVANADSLELVRSVDHMPKKVANQIIAAAKLLLKQKADSLREEADEVLEGLRS